MLQPLGVSVRSMFSINSIQYNKKSQLTNVMRLFYIIWKMYNHKGCIAEVKFLLFKLVKWLGMFIEKREEYFSIQKRIFQNALGDTIEKMIRFKTILKQLGGTISSLQQIV